jgi:hypothetical protein
VNFKYQPKDYNELMKNIENEIYNIQGTSNNPNWGADLNYIDTSQINRMFGVFSIMYSKFNGDISRWNVKNVMVFDKMFEYSKFDGDIGAWKNNFLKKQFEMKRKFIDLIVHTFPHNFSTYVFFKNNDLPVYHDSMTKSVIFLKKDEKNIFQFKEFVKLPGKIQALETLIMVIKYKDDFNFTYEEIINSLDSKYFTKNEVHDIYFLLNKENELNEKELKNYKLSLKKIIQKPITEKFKNILAKKNFVIKNLDVLNTYRKIIEIENNEEKEVLKSFLFATILKSKKGSL